MSDTLLLSNLERLGEAYCEQYLVGEWDGAELDTDWWKALKFFFSHSFMRGRNDRLSHEFYSFTIDRLQNDILKTENLDDAYRTLQQHSADFDKGILLEFKNRHRLGRRTASKHARFTEEVANRNPIIQLLTSSKQVKVVWEREAYLKEIRLGNDEDVMMVLDTLEFICTEGRRNIYAYIKQVIHDKGISAAYSDLTKLRAVKDKIATFVIRDIGLMNRGLVREDHEVAFPVDTWVRKLAGKIGCTAGTDEGIKQHFIERCKEESIDPLLVAAGLWYAGYNSLMILLDHYLGKYPLTDAVVARSCSECKP